MIGKIAALVAIGLAGAGSWLWATGFSRRRPWLDLLEVIFLAGVLTFAELLLSALLFAELGILRMPLVALVAGAYALLGGLVRSRAPPRPLRLTVPRWPCAIAGLAVAYGAATTFGASDLITGGADPGVYVAIAGNLAREGTVWHSNSAVAALPDEVADKLAPRDDGRFMELNGMVNDPLIKGRTNPQFLHGFPALLAVFKAAFGILGMLRVPPLSHILALLGLFLLLWRLVDSPAAGALAALFLATDLGQLYYARTPFTEVPNQLFFLAGAWLLALALQKSDRTLGILSAALWSAACAIRPDAYLAVAALFAAFACVPPDVPAHGVRRAFAWTLAICTTAVLGLTCITSWTYYFKNTLPETLESWALAGGAGTICLVSPFVWRIGLLARLREAVYRHGGLIGSVLGAILVAVVGWGYFIRPTLPPQYCNDAATCLHMTGMRFYDEDTFVRLAWYLSPPGLAAAALGAAALLRRHFRDRDFVLWPALVVGLAFSGLFLWQQMISPWHFWAFRRYIPAVLPFAAICMGWALTSIGAMKRTGFAIAFALTAYFVVHGVSMSRFLIRNREHEGAREQLIHIASRFPANSVLLSPAPLHNSLFFTPLQSLFGLDTVRFPTPLPDADALNSAISSWRRLGRPVLFVCRTDEKCFWPSDESELLYRFDARLDFLRVRSSFDQAPDRFDNIVTPYAAYEVVPARPENAGGRWDTPGSFQGFFGVEEWNRKAFRWSKPSAEIRIAAPPDARELGLWVAAAGTAQVPVTITVADQREHFILDPGFGKQREVRVPLPPQHSGRVVIHIESSAYSPSLAGSPDTRELGIAVFAIRVGDKLLRPGAEGP